MLELLLLGHMDCAFIDRRVEVLSPHIKAGLVEDAFS